MEAYLIQIMDLNSLVYKNCKSPQRAHAAKNPLYIGDDLELFRRKECQSIERRKGEVRERAAFKTVTPAMPWCPSEVIIFVYFQHLLFI